jgi:hypothetical protein
MCLSCHPAQASTFSATISTLAPQLSTGGFNVGTRSLFTALRQLPQLQNLELSRMQLDEVLDSQQLSALTASNVLTSLHLLARFSMPIPQGRTYLLRGQPWFMPSLRPWDGFAGAQAPCLRAEYAGQQYSQSPPQPQGRYARRLTDGI